MSIDHAGGGVHFRRTLHGKAASRRRIMEINRGPFAAAQAAPLSLSVDCKFLPHSPHAQSVISNFRRVSTKNNERQLFVMKNVAKFFANGYYRAFPVGTRLRPDRRWLAKN